MLSNITRKIKNILTEFLILFGMILSINSFAQCTITSIAVTDEVCKEEIIDIANTEINSGTYYWDFCPGDFLSAPTGTQLLATTLVDKSFSIDITNDNGSWYGFTVGNISKKIIRFDFGNDLSSIPTLVDLGTKSLFSGAQDIELVKILDDWYALVSNTNSSQLLLLEFGSSLESDPVISVINGTDLSAPYYIEIELIEGNYYAFVTNDGNTSLTRIKFGSSLSVDPESVDHITVTGGNDIRGIDIVRECDDWYGLVVSQFNKRVFKLNFGTNIDSPPTISDLVVGQGATDISIINEASNFYAMCQSISGQVIQIDYGNSLSNTGIVTNWGDLGLSTNVRGFRLVEDTSDWYAYSIDQVGRAIQIYTFANNCSASSSVSTVKQPIDFSFIEAGKHYISTKFIEDSGTIYYYLDSVQVLNNIAPDISFFNSNVVCANSAIQFTSASSLSGLDYTWDFGDTNTSGLEDPSHTYAAAGEYEVTLTVDDGTCGNFTRQMITIYNEPVPDFTLPGGIICTNQQVAFINNTPGEFDGLIMYEWQIDGVTQSMSEDLTFEFLSGGDKEIKLIAVIPGCAVEVAKNLLNIREGALPEFTFNDACLGELVPFNNQSVGTITNNDWDFGNGFTSTLENPSLEFTEDGTFDITLSITNADGCITSLIKPITIHQLPIVNFENELACENLNTQFTDLSSVDLDNLDQWEWSFGDGSPNATVQNPSNLYEQNGAYEVKLIVTSSFGCIDSLSQDISVLPAPVAAFEADKICLDVPITFSDQSEPVDGENIVNWAWNLGGEFSAQQNPQILFEAALDYEVSLTVTSENLCTSTIIEVLNISPQPEVLFSVHDNCENEKTILEDITAIEGDVITSYSWINNENQFGENDVVTEFPESQPGSYEVSLSIETEKGCEYLGTQNFSINPAPVAGFSSSPDFGAPPLLVGFTNQSTGAVSYSWDFQDGNTSDIESPTNDFLDLGEYDVKLVALNNEGCSDTTSQRISVLQPELNLSLLNLSIVENPMGDLLSLTVQNTGTVTLQRMDVSLDLGGELVVTETIIATLLPNESLTSQLDFRFSNKKLDYICASIAPTITIEETTEDDNEICLILNNETNLVSSPFPNPSKGIISFQIVATETSTVSVQIIDNQGKEVSNYAISKNLGSDLLTIDMSNQKEGIYLISVSVNTVSRLFKVVLTD